MFSFRNKKSVRWLCIGAGVTLLLGVVFVLFLLPRLINQDMVRKKIVHLLSQKIAGTVTFQNADISLFPLPRVIVRNASLTIPEKVSGTIRTLTVYAKLRPLFHGEVRLSKIQIDEPSFTLRIPDKEDDKTKSLEEIVALLRSLSLGSADIRLSIDHGSITFQKSGQPPVSVKEIALRVELASMKDDVVLTVSRLSSKDPGLFFSAVFKVNPSANLISLDARGKDLDISSIRNAALALAADVPVVLNIFDILRSGTVEQISFDSRGSALGDLGKTANMKIKGRLNRGGIVISGLDLGFREVSGDCDITEGILQGSDLKGEIMKTRISDGKLRIGLKEKDALFRADAAVAADLADVHSVLSRIVKNPAFHQELAHIKAIGGNAEGRLVLGESLLSVRAKVDISRMKFSANYDRVPLPIAVDQGSFSYEEKGVSVKNLAGTIGTSAISGLSAQMRTGNSYLEVLSGKADLDTAEVHRWLSSYEKMKEPLQKITSLSGRLNLSSFTFQGPVMDSQAWNFKIAGSAENLSISTSLLPGPLTMKSGTFNAQTGQLTIADAGVSFLDASPVVAASLNTSLDNLRKGDIRFSGTVGPKAFQWIKTAFSIPEYVRTDQALSVSDAHLTWQENGETAFEGNMKTGSGQSVAIGLAKGRDRLTISRFDVSDIASKASFSIDLQEKIKRLSFKGRLDTSTAASLITAPQVQGGTVQGEIIAEFSNDGVAGIIAQGRLQGEKIVLPWKKEMPLMIDSVDVSADKGNISIGSGRIRLGENALSLKGNVSSKEGGLVLDMDVSSDRIVWDEIVKSDGDSTTEQQQTEKKKKPLTVQGVVRLKTDRFDYEGYQIAPFYADIALSVGKTDIRIDKSHLCGIGVIGDINISSDKANSEMGLDLRFDATDQEFKQTILCLSKGKSDATGLFTLKGNLKGHGKGEDLKKVLEGKIDFAARKGAIYRYKTLDTVLDFVNKSEELGGQLPDLDKSELSYELLKITASVNKEKLIIEEAILDSAFIEVVAEGSLNLLDNRLDLNVMVAPLRQMNKIVQHIPVIGAVISGSIISVPIKVTGTTSEPNVTYLSPSAAASNLVNMMKRTLNLPVSILSPLFPKEKQE